MPGPRVLIVAGVKPLNAASEGLQISVDGDGKSETDKDVDHASDLAILAMTQVDEQK
jgi:hypothetical protein